MTVPSSPAGSPPPSSAPPPPPGWSRLLVKSRLGMGRDFTVRDAYGQEILIVDGALGPIPRAEIRDAAGHVHYRVTGRLLSIPKQMTITDAAGGKVAELRAKMFSPMRERMTLTLGDGSTWDVQGSILERNYAVSAGGQPVAQVTQKWMTVRDTYAVDFRNDVPPALVMAVVWTIDRWVEQR